MAGGGCRRPPGGRWRPGGGRGRPGAPGGGRGRGQWVLTHLVQSVVMTKTVTEWVYGDGYTGVGMGVWQSEVQYKKVLWMSRDKLHLSCFCLNNSMMEHFPLLSVLCQLLAFPFCGSFKLMIFDKL